MARCEHLWAAAVVTSLTLVFFSPVFRYDGSFSAVYAHQKGTYPWVKPGDPPVFTLHDQADYVYPRQVFLDRSLKEQGQLPLWNPLTFAGHPFFAETGSRIAYPPFLLLTLLLSPILMHDVYLMIHIAGAGLSMFALMKQLRCRFAGSLLAAVAWAFSSYGLLYYVLEMYAAVAALLPLVLLFVARAHERRSWRSILTASLLLGLLFLGTSVELAFMSFACVGLYAGSLAVSRAVRDRKSRTLRQQAPALLAPAVLMGGAVGVAAIGILPFLDLSARSGRATVPYTEIMRHFPHMRVSDFARMFVAPDAPLRSRGVSQQVFLGTATALLAVVGFFSRRTGAAFGRSLLVVLFLFAVGGPGTWLAYQLPGINKLHGVGRALFLFNLGLAVLAGIGLDRVLGWRRGPAPTDGTSSGRAERASLAPANGRARGRTALAVGLTGLCVLTIYQQLFSYGRGIHPPFQRRDPASLLPPTPATEAARAVLHRMPGGGRVLPVIRQGVPPALGYTLPAATGMALDLPTTGGYEPVLPEHVATLWRVLSGEPLPSVMERKLNDTALNAQTLGDLARVDLLPRLGVAAVLGPPTMTEQPGWDQQAAERRGLRLAYSGTDGVVYEVVDRSPRAFVVHEATPVDSPAQALVRFESPSFDARQEVILDRRDANRRGSGTAHPGSTASETRVHWQQDKPNRLVLSVDSTRDGWLVLLDSWDPGWRATVDGRAAPVLRADYGFRAVPIGAGSSTVTFSYRPMPVVVGAWVSALATSGILMFVVVATVRRRRRRPTADDAGHSEVLPAVGRTRSPRPTRPLVAMATRKKVLRYSAASVVNVAVAEVVLALAFGVLRWSALSASVLAACVAALPAYWLARHWVWGRSGRSHLLKEVLPFWMLALLGLVLATSAAHVSERIGMELGLSRLGQTLIVMGGVLAASAAFWVLKFVLLNRVLFADRRPSRGDSPGERLEVHGLQAGAPAIAPEGQGAQRY